MENKKLLGYILKDLIELEDIFGERSSLQLDEIETEFVQNRVKSARKLVQMFIDHPEEHRIAMNQENQKNDPKSEFAKPTTQAPAPEIKPAKLTSTVITEIPAKPFPDARIEALATSEPIGEQKPVTGLLVNEIMGFVEETITDMAREDGKALPTDAEEDWQQIKPGKASQFISEVLHQELGLEEGSTEDQQNKRLGDSFLKEKSVNELMSDETQKLEYKISNMPVSSIQAGIGINDRFQYIRELFDGNAAKYAETVEKLDAMPDLKEAVVFLQQNFKWKKTEVSLKFVNLIKRRFPNG